MSHFQDVMPNLVDARKELQKSVEKILKSETNGRLLLTTETQNIDFKEEAGRRIGNQIQPGESENPSAATKLADEVACMANSPGGGALIFGVEDETGNIIGTELDMNWLRQRIYSAIDIAPHIDEHVIAGQRILVLFISEAPEPVEDTSGRLRWRIGDSCKPVDRAEWWHHQSRLYYVDEMAKPSSLTWEAATSESLAIIREKLGPQEQLTHKELLRSIGALTPDDFLTAAAALTLTPASKQLIETTVFDVPGGSIINRLKMSDGISLLEQIAATEIFLDALNDQITLENGFQHRMIHRIPPSAIREAILNGIIHRDWNRGESTELIWTTMESSLEVRSPGGFPKGITQENFLSNRAPRYPSLADLFRAMGFVDKQGVGIDRMYQSMIVLGHNPPQIKEVSGPFVECRLVGGLPVIPILKVVDAFTPKDRKKDYRISIILHHLLHHPFITASILEELLQSDASSTAIALKAALQTSVNGTSLIKAYKKAWLLGDTAVKILKESNNNKLFPFLAYHTTDEQRIQSSAEEWLKEFGAITTGDLVELTNVSRGTVKKTLDAMSEEGIITSVGQGRSAKYLSQEKSP